MNRENAEVRYVGKRQRQWNLRKGTLGRVVEDHGTVLTVKFDQEPVAANGIVVQVTEVEFTGGVRRADGQNRPQQLDKRGPAWGA